MLKITAGQVHCMCLGICFYLFILPMIHCVYPSFYQSGICNHCVFTYYHCTISFSLLILGCQLNVLDFLYPP